MDVLTTINQSPAPLRFQSGEIFYPESDGEPMAETDVHANLLIYLRKGLEIFFADREDVYISGNIMFYYVEDDPTQVILPDVMVVSVCRKATGRAIKYGRKTMLRRRR